ncbi:hypothetical protein ACPYOC_12495 [Ornithinimicrobium sp. W1665]|uniref:hypothetical protein n=1 Tax=Ornithinimicrobium sp. W1665 TaxID=3416666 RepID=UPI003CE91D12
MTWFRPPYVALRLDGWAGASEGRACGSSRPAPPSDWQPELDDDHQRIALLRQEVSPGDVDLAHDWVGEEDNGLPGTEPVVDRGWLCAGALDAFAERGQRTSTPSQAAAEGDARTSVRVVLRRGDGNH